MEASRKLETTSEIGERGAILQHPLPPHRIPSPHSFKKSSDFTFHTFHDNTFSFLILRVHDQDIHACIEMSNALEVGFLFSERLQSLPEDELVPALHKAVSQFLLTFCHKLEDDFLSSVLVGMFISS